MEVTIGGNRLGSGPKMTTDLNEYGRSTHNLSKKFRSSMGCGMLIPCYRKIALRGDKFEINMNADCRTIPAKGALFGSYKMQIDFFAVPLRLYQGILHNNPLNIGLQMQKVRLPKIRLYETHVKNSGGQYDKDKWTKYKKEGRMGNSSLMKYLGLSGIGTMEYDDDSTTYYRDVDACKVLAYYDIYKNYYANKQEEKGYVIGGQTLEPFRIISLYENQFQIGWSNSTTTTGYGNDRTDAQKIVEGVTVYMDWITCVYTDSNDNPASYDDVLNMPVLLYDYNSNIINTESNQQTWKYVLENSKNITNSFTSNTLRIMRNSGQIWYLDGKRVYGIMIGGGRMFNGENGIKIREFDLSKIDDMRYALLTFNQLGQTANINPNSDTFDIEPYVWLCEQEYIYENDNTKYTSNKFGCYGLALKTYQNDLFNNWLNTEWIEGENGITEMTKLVTTEGYITIDAISFATKQYLLLNRIAVCGNTYQDWEDAVYEKIKSRHIETPMFIGGMSKEIVFDEVVQTAPAEIEGEDSYLGKLGGRGRALEGQNGGHIIYKCEEASIIMGIISLTPRINYTQGNDFEMTEIDSVDDLHKPGYDGIGFQDLVGERLAYFDTKLDDSGNVVSRTKIGKVPAWIEYMTDVDEAYGDFAESEGEQGGFMVLNRNYEMDNEGYIKDATTYIDPEKYNYAFAYTALDAQNFWVQINFDIKARRKMSARIMPNV